MIGPTYVICWECEGVGGKYKEVEYDCPHCANYTPNSTYVCIYCKGTKKFKKTVYVICNQCKGAQIIYI